MGDLLELSTIELLQQAKEIFDEITRRDNDKMKTLSMLDTKISSLYHKAEVENFSASKGYAISKELQSLLRMRRVVKYDIDTLTALDRKEPRDSIGGKHWKGIRNYLNILLVKQGLSKRNEGNQVYTNDNVLGKCTHRDIETYKDSNI